MQILSQENRNISCFPLIPDHLMLTSQLNIKKPIFEILSSLQFFSLEDKIFAKLANLDVI